MILLTRVIDWQGMQLCVIPIERVKEHPVSLRTLDIKAYLELLNKINKPGFSCYLTNGYCYFDIDREYLEMI